MSSLFSKQSTRAVKTLVSRAVASGSGSSRYASSSSSAGSSSSSQRPFSLLLRLTPAYNVRLEFPLPSFVSGSGSGSSSLPPLALASEAPSSSVSEQEQAEDPLQWDGFLNAVPKSKVSHSRKRMRSANKGLKDRVDLVHCASCGTPKVSHHICATCFGDIVKRQKAEIRLRSSLINGEVDRVGLTEEELEEELEEEEELREEEEEAKMRVRMKEGAIEMDLGSRDARQREQGEVRK